MKIIKCYWLFWLLLTAQIFAGVQKIEIDVGHENIRYRYQVSQINLTKNFLYIKPVESFRQKLTIQNLQCLPQCHAVLDGEYIKVSASKNNFAETLWISFSSPQNFLSIENSQHQNWQVYAEQDLEQLLVSVNFSQSVTKNAAQNVIEQSALIRSAKTPWLVKEIKLDMEQRQPLQFVTELRHGFKKSQMLDLNFTTPHGIDVVKTAEGVDLELERNSRKSFDISSYGFDPSSKEKGDNSKNDKALSAQELALNRKCFWPFSEDDTAEYHFYSFNKSEKILTQIPLIFRWEKARENKSYLLVALPKLDQESKNKSKDKSQKLRVRFGDELLKMIRQSQTQLLVFDQKDNACQELLFQKTIVFKNGKNQLIVNLPQSQVEQAAYLAFAVPKEKSSIGYWHQLSIAWQDFAYFKDRFHYILWIPSFVILFVVAAFLITTFFFLILFVLKNIQKSLENKKWQRELKLLRYNANEAFTLESVVKIRDKIDKALGTLSTEYQMQTLLRSVYLGDGLKKELAQKNNLFAEINKSYQENRSPNRTNVKNIFSFEIIKATEVFATEPNHRSFDLHVFLNKNIIVKTILFAANIFSEKEVLENRQDVIIYDISYRQRQAEFDSSWQEYVLDIPFHPIQLLDRCRFLLSQYFFCLQQGIFHSLQKHATTSFLHSLPRKIVNIQFQELERLKIDSYLVKNALIIADVDALFYAKIDDGFTQKIHGKLTVVAQRTQAANFFFQQRCVKCHSVLIDTQPCSTCKTTFPYPKVHDWLLKGFIIVS